MEKKHGAQRARWGSCAHTPTGFRRMTPGLLRADRTAAGFDGLPEGVESPGQLLAAFKAAAPRLGISPRLVHAVDWLFRFTQPQDWARGGRPIGWPSTEMQRTALGLERSQVKEINRRLIELGLVTMKDSPNGKRYGKRDAAGRIVEAYGFDLSPIAMPDQPVEIRQTGIKGFATCRSLYELARWTYVETARVPLRLVRWKPAPDFSVGFRNRDAQNREEVPAKVGEEPELL